MNKKNPLLAGLLNMLVPGLSYLYIDNDRGRFLKTLAGGLVAIVVMFLLGNIVQRTPGYSLPSGICFGGLLLLVWVPLFRMGQKVAHQHNFLIDNASVYNARQHGSKADQLAKNQNLRNKGMISEQEYESRKDNISSNK